MPELEILLIAFLVVQACIIPGVFLVLRGMSLLSDAISHACLLGIVLAFFVVGSLDSIWLIIAAAATGVLTVMITEWLISTQRLKEDAAIGLVFPVFFSLGVICITHYLGSIHIDSDCILFGEITFAPFERFLFNGQDLGPKALWTMGIICSLNTLFVTLFYKEFKLSTFDKGLAYTLGFSPALLHYGLMLMTSITAVGAFESVGSILVVALMITPPATAYLLTRKLSKMLFISSLIGILSVFLGYLASYLFDISISGSIVTASGLLFLLTLCLSPKNGLLMQALNYRKQRLEFSSRMLLVQLFDHEGKANEYTENTITNMITHMQWTPKFANKIASFSTRKGYIKHNKNQLHLTDFGREVAKQTLVSYPLG